MFKQRLNLLKERIESFSPPRKSNVNESRILMLGPVGAGKSSFYNTIAAIFSGHITVYAPSGSGERSITSKYRMYKLRCSDSDKPMKFRMCDTRGLEDYQGIDQEDVKQILQGQIREHHLFQDSVLKPYLRWFWKVAHVLSFLILWIGHWLNLVTEPPVFTSKTPLKDRVHCVCMLIDGSTATVLPDLMVDKIKSIQTFVRDAGVPFMLIMTKIDKMCKEVDDDVSKAFDSKTIQDQVNRVAQDFGLPRNHILLVKNYEREYVLNVKISILALVALNVLLGATRDYINNSLDE